MPMISDSYPVWIVISWAGILLLTKIRTPPLCLLDDPVGNIDNLLLGI